MGIAKKPDIAPKQIKEGAKNDSRRVVWLLETLLFCVPPHFVLKNVNERHSRGKREIGYLEKLLLLPDDLQPFLDAGVSDDFPHINVGIVQEYVGVLVDMFEGVQKVVFYVFIGVAAVDKGDIDRGQPKGFEG